MCRSHSSTQASHLSLSAPCPTAKGMSWNWENRDNTWGGHAGQGAWTSEEWKSAHRRQEKQEKQDKYSNVTTLGLKHPMPLEDRKDLILGLATRLQEDVSASGASASGTTGNFRTAVASWGPVLIMGVLFFLCRAKASMQIRVLKNPDGSFVMEDAVELLWMELVG